MGAELNLHPVGLSEEERKILTVTANVMHADGCGVTFSDEKSRNTVVVIDVDSEEGRSFYEHSVDSDLRVVISGDNKNYRAVGLIRKPLRVQTLRNLLTELSEKILPDNEAQAPSAEISSPVTEAALSTLPNDTLFYVMVNAVANNQLLAVKCAEQAHPILIHGPSRHIYTGMTRAEFEKSIGTGTPALSVSSLDEFEFMKLARGISSFRIEKLLWIAERFGAKGYTPSEKSSGLVVHLNDWPRFEIHNVKPEYLTLAAITTRRFLSFEQLARMTGIKLSTIYDFYHGALVCGVVEHRFVERPQQIPKEESAAVPSLVSRIAKKLGLSFF